MKRGTLLFATAAVSVSVSDTFAAARSLTVEYVADAFGEKGVLAMLEKDGYCAKRVF
jgi:hypothetical protein